MRDKVKYNFLAIEEACDNINTFVGAMSDHLHGVETRMEAKMAEWDGETRSAYVAAKVVWNETASEISRVMMSLSGQLRKANQNMAATEHELSRKFM